jgi:hypothetical protein
MGKSGKIHIHNGKIFFTLITRNSAQLITKRPIKTVQRKMFSQRKGEIDAPAHLTSSSTRLEVRRKTFSEALFRGQDNQSNSQKTKTNNT